MSIVLPVGTSAQTFTPQCLKNAKKNIEEKTKILMQCILSINVVKYKSKDRKINFGYHLIVMLHFKHQRRNISHCTSTKPFLLLVLFSVYSLFYT